MTKLFKALGATLLAAGLVVAGVAGPAEAVNPVGTFNSNGATFYTQDVFSYGFPNTSRPRVGFYDNGFLSGTTYYIKLVGVSTSVSSCTTGSDDMGSYALPGGATLVARYGNGPYEYAPTCTITSSGSGASSTVTVATTAPAGIMSPSGGYLTFSTGVFTADPAATNVTAYVSVDQSTWTQLGIPASIGYGVILDANGGTVGGGGTTVSKYSATSSWTATAAMNNGITKSGYGFDGWTTDSQNTGNVYTTGSAVTLSTTPLTLYAKWSVSQNVPNNNVPNNNVPNNNQNITPCTNGTGTYMLQVMGSPGRTSGNAGDCLFRSTQASTVAPANVFTRAGYTFSGWRTSQNVAVPVGASVTATAGMPTVLYAVWTAANSTPRATATLSLNINRGEPVHQAPAPIVASGLQPNAPYTVEVHSTPVIIASGNVANDGSVNYTASIPAGLEAGWHTMIFTSTAADGTSFTSTYYFKVAGDGTLLSTSETLPAELASTGVDGTSMTFALFGGLALAVMGAAMIMIARRKRSN